MTDLSRKKERYRSARIFKCTSYWATKPFEWLSNTALECGSVDMRNLNEVDYRRPQHATAFLQAVEQAVAMWFISDTSPSPGVTNADMFFAM